MAQYITIDKIVNTEMSTHGQNNKHIKKKKFTFNMKITYFILIKYLQFRLNMY